MGKEKVMRFACSSILPHQKEQFMLISKIMAKELYSILVHGFIYRFAQ